MNSDRTIRHGHCQRRLMLRSTTSRPHSHQSPPRQRHPHLPTRRVCVLLSLIVLRLTPPPHRRLHPPSCSLSPRSALRVNRGIELCITAIVESAFGSEHSSSPVQSTDSSRLVRNVVPHVSIV